jgi:hypothetical protein
MLGKPLLADVYHATVIAKWPSDFAIGVGRSHWPFRGFLPRKTTPRSRLSCHSHCETAFLEFFLEWHADVRNKPRIGGLEALEIAASLAEAKVAIDCSADLVGVTVILTVILPPADLA